MLQDERTAEASGKGFYIYDDKRKASIDPELAKYVEKSRRLSGFAPDSMIAGLTDKDIVEMLFFPVVNEACRILDEGISVKCPDLDIASIMGMSFPSYRGGILFWADTMGTNYVYSRLMTWCKLYGGFFKPCDYLVERVIRVLSLVRSNLLKFYYCGFTVLMHEIISCIFMLQISIAALNKLHKSDPYDQ
ncbi:glyoxysomal fatty acid beta-oxidation multifunctional protein MFP-a-like [Carex rostrata]